MKIALDLGHGIGIDRGAVGLIEEEEIINGIGNIVYKKLLDLGHDVILVRPRFGISTLLQSLTHRTMTSNSFGSDLFISIHANVGGVDGSVVFTYKGKALPQAVRILENLSCLGFSNRGVKDGSNLYVIKYTVANALLVEVCSTDNSDDVTLYNNLGNEKIAEAIVNGIDRSGIKVINNYEEDKKIWISKLQTEINKQGFGNIIVDGIAGIKTLDACPQVSKGAKGNITKLIQERLNIDPDGIFGTITVSTVIEFQRSHNLVTDGVVGRNTWEKLLVVG